MVLEKPMSAEEMLKQLIEAGHCAETDIFANECEMAIEAFAISRDGTVSPEDMLSLLRLYNEGTAESGTPIMPCEVANAISLLLKEVPAKMLLETPPSLFVPFVNKAAADDLANTLDRLEEME